MIRRRNVVDPLVEKGSRWAPYVYGFIDPDGIKSGGYIGGSGARMTTSGMPLVSMKFPINHLGVNKINHENYSLFFISFFIASCSAGLNYSTRYCKANYSKEGNCVMDVFCENKLTILIGGHSELEKQYSYQDSSKII